jgi:hypothetical protein
MSMNGVPYDQEHRAERYVITLRHFIEPMGGRLEVRPIFRYEDVQIAQRQWEGKSEQRTQGIEPVGGPASEEKLYLRIGTTPDGNTMKNF